MIKINFNQCMSAVQELPPKAELYPAGSDAFCNPPLGVLLVWLVGTSSGLKPVFILGPFGQDLGTG